MADENNTGDEQFTPDGSMEPLSPQEADATDYGLMDTGERIQRKDLQQEMRESYLAYALSVIVERALPDVRDGMKPVHRRVIYAMYDGGYRPDRGYNKCSRVVGDVMGKYHPHGDSAIYDTLVRMAQSWSMRNMLVDGQGNFGSPGDDPAAAMRYTECRMAPLAMEMVRDIDKDTVDFVPNYDGKTQEPTVLPARFPNLLVNGSAGIAVGMATNIPPHNMREVADGVHWALDHPDASREELLENLIRIIKGPDFPTGATILGHKGIEQAYRTGRGLITMRAVVNTEEINGRMCLVVTELPYQVNPDRLVVSIREAVRDGKIQGIADMRDETSGRTGQRLVLVLKRPVHAFGHLAHVVRRNIGGHTHGDAGGAVDQQVREAGRQYSRFLGFAVVVGHEVDGVLVDVAHHLHGQRGHTAFGVTHGGGRVVARGTEVTLTVDEQVAHRPGLGHAHQSVIDGGVAVRMVFTHDVADHAGALVVAAVGAIAAVVHRVDHTAVHGFHAVAHVRQSTFHDDGKGVG